jgi:hypothetical protein
MVSMIT